MIMHKTVLPKIFIGTFAINCDIGKYSLKSSNGALNTKILMGNLLIKNVSVKTDSPQIYFGILVVKLQALATSRRCLFFRPATSFCWCVLTQELWWIMPLSQKQFPSTWLKYSFPSSLLKILIWVWNCVYHIIKQKLTHFQPQICFWVINKFNEPAFSWKKFLYFIDPMYQCESWFMYGWGENTLQQCLVISQNSHRKLRYVLTRVRQSWNRFAGLVFQGMTHQRDRDLHLA